MILNVDLTRLNERIAEFSDVMQSDARVIVQDETRLLTKMVMSLTPPSPGLTNAAKKLGEAAIASDLAKIFTPVSENFLNFVGSKFGVRNIKATLNSKGKKGVQYNLDWERLDPTGAGMQEFHHKQMNNRGRPYRNKNVNDGKTWRAAYVVMDQDLDALRTKEQAKVGRAKASFGIAYQSLGGKVPKWIARHLAGARGYCINNILNSEFPNVTVQSHAPGITQIENVVRQAVRARGTAIGRKIKIQRAKFSEASIRGIKAEKLARSNA